MNLLWPAVAALGVSSAWNAVAPTSQVFGPTIFDTPNSGTLALTFDDGPNPATTPKLLTLLTRHSLPATFFLVGRFARECPELVREIKARGHQIGNHTETHPSLAFRLPATITQELVNCRQSIAAALGAAADSQTAMWLRPPFGFRGPQLQQAVRSAGLSGVAMWSLTCYDWKPQRPERLIARLGRVGKRALWRAGHGDVVLLHDGDFRHQGADRDHVLKALEYWLPRWRDAGHRFVTIDELAKKTAGA